MIEIDGTYAEGGGQILRTALALSVITSTPFHISRIRARRPAPGLKRQHRTAIQAFETLSAAKASPFDVGTGELTFEPGVYKAQKLPIDIGTAGSITLLLQALLIPMIFAKEESHFFIRGGTDVPWSPPIDFFTNVIVPHLTSLAKISVKVNRRGFYPRGGGEVEVRVKPGGERKPLRLTEQGELKGVHGKAFASAPLRQADVADRMADQAIKGLQSYQCPIVIKREYADSLSTGASLVLWSEHVGPAILGADSLGERGVPSEKVAEKGVEKFLSELSSSAAVDVHTADHLIPYLGLLGGAIRTSEISEHMRACMYVTESFLGVKFAVDEENGVVSVDRQSDSPDKEPKRIQELP